MLPEGTRATLAELVAGDAGCWALWTAFLAPVIGVGLALPLHYVYGLATLGHLGLIYLDAAILLVGFLLAHRALAR